MVSLRQRLAKSSQISDHLGKNKKLYSHTTLLRLAAQCLWNSEYSLVGVLRCEMVLKRTTTITNYQPAIQRATVNVSSNNRRSILMAVLNVNYNKFVGGENFLRFLFCLLTKYAVFFRDTITTARTKCDTPLFVWWRGMSVN